MAEETKGENVEVKPIFTSVFLCYTLMWIFVAQLRPQLDQMSAVDRELSALCGCSES